MKVHSLLPQRDTLLQRARLANVAFTHHRLADFGVRISRDRLQGADTLCLGDPGNDHPWPVLHSLETNASVIEEHLTGADIAGLADIIAFLHGDGGTAELDFRLGELANRYLPDLRRQLAQAGFALAPAPQSAEDLRHERG